MARFLLVCFAGALGSGARYLVGLWTVATFGTAFPYGTLIVNVVGSFFISLLLALGATTKLLPPATLLTLTTGFIGGFTTYSAFNAETLRFFSEGQYKTAALYVASTLVVCLAAGVLGLATARWIAQASSAM